MVFNKKTRMLLFFGTLILVSGIVFFTKISNESDFNSSSAPFIIGFIPIIIALKKEKLKIDLKKQKHLMIFTFISIFMLFIIILLAKVIVL